MSAGRRSGDPGPCRDARVSQGGQSFVEFTLILPVFMIMLIGMLEFGAVFDHRTAMAYAVREGARVGASLGNGGAYPNTVDPTIVGAVQRGLTDPLLVENITAIVIFKSDGAGQPVGGAVNTYDRNGVLVGAAGWPATARVVGLSGDSIGVMVRYDYHPTTPLGALFGFFYHGNPPFTTIPMSDATVMKLEPVP